MAGLTMRGCRSCSLSAECEMKGGLCQKEMGVSESLTEPIPGASDIGLDLGRAVHGQQYAAYFLPFGGSWRALLCSEPEQNQFALQRSAYLPAVVRVHAAHTLLDSSPKDTPSQGLSHRSVTAICCALWDNDKMSLGSAAKRCDRSLCVFVHCIGNAENTISHKLDAQRQ